MIESAGMDATDTGHVEDNAIVSKGNRGDGIGGWLAHVQNARGRIVEQNSQTRRGVTVVFIFIRVVTAEWSRPATGPAAPSPQRR
jgi:hypothetical protein